MFFFQNVRLVPMLATNYITFYHQLLVQLITHRAGYYQTVYWDKIVCSVHNRVKWNCKQKWFTTKLFQAWIVNFRWHVAMTSTEQPIRGTPPEWPERHLVVGIHVKIDKIWLLNCPFCPYSIRQNHHPRTLPKFYTINVLAKFENDAWNITGVQLTHPLSWGQNIL